MVTTRLKKRLFLAMLTLLVLWPLVHYALSRLYRINHWRFAGFAMYARPAYVPYLTFTGTLPDGPLTPQRLRAALGKDGSARIDSFVARRRLWGDLARPDSVGRLVLARLPELRALEVIIITVGLEPGDSYLSYEPQHYRYR